MTLLAGLFFPEQFWWLFVICECTSLLTMLILSRLPGFRKRGEDVPVYSASMDNNNHELQRVLDRVTAFCDRLGTPKREQNLIRLAVEELCMVTIEKAFSGKPDEYIQLTLSRETNGDYTMYIRNSAPFFNPLELMESIGVMMVRQKVKSLRFRHYQGFNLMTVII